jgi:hypothetical protein
MPSRVTKEVVHRCQIEHIVGICRENAAWHRRKFKETGDRYWLGQWKAYSRMAKRGNLEYDVITSWK